MICADKIRKARHRFISDEALLSEGEGMAAAFAEQGIMEGAGFAEAGLSEGIRFTL